MIGEALEKADLVVLGAGPGGYAAAFRAADLGRQVVLVDSEPRLGGVCLLRGCIPSKAMIAAAELVNRLRHAGNMGIVVGDLRLDFAQLARWRNQIVQDLARGVEQLCRQRGIRRLTGQGVLRSSHELFVSGSDGNVVLQFQHLIVATGSRPAMPPPFRHHDAILTSDEALALEHLPQDLLVVGGGYIGIELGTCFATLGSRVTIVEVLDRLLPGVEPELVRVVHKRLSERGVRIHLQSRVTSLTCDQGRVTVHVQPHQGATWSETYDCVLVAVGRQPRTNDIGLERAGVAVDDKGFILVDEQCRTSQKHIYAAGDCTGPPFLAHRAKHMGLVAAEVACGRVQAFEPRTIPIVVFSDPEIACCGLSEEEAASQGRRVHVGRFRFGGSGRARTLDETEGLVVVVADADTGAVLGVRMVGPQVSELIAEATLAVEMGATLEDVTSTIHAHPTLAECLHEAAEAARGMALHVYRIKR
ncbi:MAG: dihydrolipoyl dehydrogenase [Gemmataceae bacterium]